MNFIQECDGFARQLPLRSPPVPVGHPLIGKIGLCIPGVGFRVQGMSRSSLNALLRDEDRFRKAPEKLVKKALRERGAITTWDGVLAARGGGKGDDFMGFKASQTTVANQWSIFYRSTGVPGAGAYTNIPGGAVHTRASAGAWPLISPTDPDKKYLLSPGANHLTGTNIVCLVDLLVAAGNINANATGAQTVNTTALTRYTDGVGVMMIFDVTTALGATASNVTVAYTNQAGTGSRSTGAIAMTTSCIVYRAQPVSGGIIMPLQATDYGVRSVQTVTFSAAMAAGVVSILLYKPLWLIPTLGATYWVEPTTPQMLSGFTELVVDGSFVMGCLTPFVLTSTTSTGVQTYMLKTCMG